MRMTRISSIVLALALSLHGGLFAQTDPFPDSTAKYVSKWRDSRFGMFIHWGPVSLKGTEISWSRGDQVPRGEYDSLYLRFNPTGFNAKEWVDLAKAGGVQYITLTTKHHDGFCLWNTQYTGYNIMKSPFARDVTKELSDECARQGIRFEAYYSITDWYQPDWLSTSHGGPGYALPAGRQPNINNYLTFAKNQLHELVANYNPDAIWFDNGDQGSWTPTMGWNVYTALKQQKPSIVLNNRAGWGPDHASLTPGFAGDFATPEKKIGAFNDSMPWETCNTIADQWSYRPNNQVRATESYIFELVNVIGGDGNYMLNLGPGPDGKFVQAEADRFREVGKWVTAHGEGIYATRGGPYLPGSWGGSTHKGNLVYLHILAWTGDQFFLPALPQKILSYRRLGGGAVDVAQSDRGVTVTIPFAGRDALGETIELTLAAPVAKPIQTAVNGTPFGNGAYGQWISQSAAYVQSSEYPGFTTLHDNLLNGATYAGDLAFHTQQEAGANIVIDLGQDRTVKGLEIDNRQDAQYFDRAKTLAVWISEDKVTWNQVWSAAQAQSVWAVTVNGTVAGKPVVGRNARYVKIGLQETNYLHLKSVKVYGELQPGQYTVNAKAPTPGLDKPFLEASAAGIRYSVPRTMTVSLDVLDARGAVLARLDQGIRGPGRYQTGLGKIASRPGPYWVRLKAGPDILIRRIHVLR